MPFTVVRKLSLEGFCGAVLGSLGLALLALAQLGAAQIGTDPLASPWPALARLLARLRLVWLGPPWATTLQSFLPTPPLAPKTCPQQIPQRIPLQVQYLSTALQKASLFMKITLVRKFRLVGKLRW